MLTVTNIVGFFVRKAKTCQCYYYFLESTIKKFFCSTKQKSYIVTYIKQISVDNFLPFKCYFILLPCLFISEKCMTKNRLLSFRIRQQKKYFYCNKVSLSCEINFQMTQIHHHGSDNEMDMLNPRIQ